MPNDGQHVQKHESDAEFREGDMDRRKPSRNIHGSRTGDRQRKNKPIQAGMRGMREPALPSGHAVRQRGCAADKPDREQNDSKRQYRPAAPCMNFVKKQIEWRRLNAEGTSHVRSLDRIGGRKLRNTKAKQHPMRGLLHK